jgi:hypothetical protein
MNEAESETVDGIYLSAHAGPWKLLLRGNRGNITYEGSDYPARIAEIYIRMTKALHDGGAKIILGTDTEVNIDY